MADQTNGSGDDKNPSPHFPIDAQIGNHRPYRSIDIGGQRLLFPGCKNPLHRQEQVDVRMQGKALVRYLQQFLGTRIRFEVGMTKTGDPLFPPCMLFHDFSRNVLNACLVEQRSLLL